MLVSLTKRVVPGLVVGELAMLRVKVELGAQLALLDGLASGQRQRSAYLENSSSRSLVALVLL